MWPITHILLALSLARPAAFADTAVCAEDLRRLKNGVPASQSSARHPPTEPERPISATRQKELGIEERDGVRDPHGENTDKLAAAYIPIFRNTDRAAAAELLRGLIEKREIPLDVLANVEGLFLLHFGKLPDEVPAAVERTIEGKSATPEPSALKESYPTTDLENSQRPSDHDFITPERLALKEPNLETIVEIAEILSHGQKLFDRRSDLSALVKMVLDGTDSGLGGKHEGYWATHGLAHAINIAMNTIKLQNAIRAAGGGRIYADDQLQDAHDSQVKWMASVFGGLAHDSGMDSPSPGSNKALREDHWRVVGHLAYGAKVPGLEVSQLLVEKFVATLVAEGKNPLIPPNPLKPLLRENAVANLLFKQTGRIPDEKQVQQATQDGKFSKEALEAEMRILAKELFLIGYSHGSDEKTGFDPKMGIQHLAERREAYLAELQRGMQRSPEAKADLALHYPNDPQFSHFMIWAGEAAKNLPDTHPMRRLAHAFNTSEGLINAADANRARGGARLFGANGTQVIPYWYEPVPGATDERGNVAGWRAYAVILGARTGKKLLVDVGDRVAAGTFLRDFELEKGPNGKAVFHTEVYPPKTSNADISRGAAEMAGRIVGETFAYMGRGTREFFGGSPGSKPLAHELPRLVIDFPGQLSRVDADGRKVEGSDPVFEAVFAEQVTNDMAKVLFRNEMLPPALQAKVLTKLVPGKKPGTMETEYDVSNPDVQKYVRDLWSFNPVDKPAKISDVSLIRANVLPKDELQFSPNGNTVKADDGNPLSKKVVSLGPKEIAAYTRDLVRGGAYGGERQIHIGDVEGASLFRTVRPENLLEGAYEMTVGNDSDTPREVTLIRRDGAPGNIYLLKNVNGKIHPDASTGQKPIPIAASDESLSILGATVYVRNEEEFQRGRSATVRVVVPARGSISMVVVPPRTAFDFWNADVLATPGSLEDFREQLRRMEYPGFVSPATEPPH